MTSAYLPCLVETEALGGWAHPRDPMPGYPLT